MKAVDLIRENNEYDAVKKKLEKLKIKRNYRI